MKSRPYVLGLGGSLRPSSTSLVALQRAAAAATRAGADVEVLTVADLDLPLYDDRPDPSGYPESVSTLLAATRRARGIIISTPVYHGVMSGSVKNVLDFLELMADDDPPWLESKIVGLITVAGGRPRNDAIVSLELACRALRAWTVPIGVSASDDAIAGDEVVDAAIAARIDRMSEALVAAVSRG